MPTDWLDELRAPSGAQSFVDRARNAPDDNDDEGDAIIRDDFPHALLVQDDAEDTAFQQFIRHWMNERHAPDILPGQEELLGRLLDHARKQVSPCRRRVSPCRRRARVASGR